MQLGLLETFLFIWGVGVGIGVVVFVVGLKISPEQNNEVGTFLPSLSHFSFLFLQKQVLMLFLQRPTTTSTWVGPSVFRLPLHLQYLFSLS